MRTRRRFAGRLGVTLLGASQGALVTRGATANAIQERRAFSFTVIGDTPYRDSDEAQLAKVLATQGADTAFVLHLGDLKGGLESCADELLRRRHAVIAASPRPLIFVPGDNEWVDCRRAMAGGHPPLQRLALLRRLFHQNAPPEAIFRDFQRQTARGSAGPEFPEHSRWRHQGVGFLTLNVPGSEDARDTDPAMQRANAERRAATLQWLQQGADWVQALSLRAAVIASHANPGFERDRPRRAPVRVDDPHDPYAWWREGLRRFSQQIRVPVLLMHGDTHRFRFDQPLRDASGATLPQVARLECFGNPWSASWVRVGIGTGDPVRFEIATRELESTLRP